MTEVIKRLADFSEALGDAPIPGAFLGKAFGRVIRPSDKDVVEIKDALVERLRKLDRRILVIVDDIDRLTADEIRQLFRVVKAVADFPNTIYLLAFDKEVAIQAVQQLQGASGADYLEKIVQVPFELPLPDREALRRLLFEKLGAILDGTPEELFDGFYWTNVYFEGIDQFIETPRDVVRLVNTLGVTYAAVKAEVNAVDFVAIEALRVFAPSLYDLIRRNPGEFAGFMPPSLHGRAAGDRGFHQATLASVAERHREAVQRLLSRLFPRLQAVWGNTSYGAESATGWRKRLRICSPDVFPVYFRLAVPEGALSYAELQAILALADDADLFGTKLVELAEQRRPDGTTRASALLTRLEDYTGDEIAFTTIGPLVCALLGVGDRLLRPEDEPRGFLGYGNSIRIGRVVWQLLKRLDEPARFTLLMDAIGRSASPATIVDQVVVLGQQHGKYGADSPDRPDDQLVTAEHLQNLEELALGKIRDAARDGTLERSPRLLSILYRWRDWAGAEEGKQWLRGVTATDDGLLALLEQLVHTTRTWAASDLAIQSQTRFNLEAMAAFVEPMQFVDRARKLAQAEGAPASQRTAVALYLQAAEGMGRNDDERPDLGDGHKEP